MRERNLIPTLIELSSLGISSILVVDISILIPLIIVGWVCETGEITMSWEDIIKGEREYGFYLKQIEKIQDLMDKLYEDIEKAAVKMNQETGYPLEDARKLIQKMQGDTIKAAEETLEELKKKLQDSMRD